MTYYCFFFTDAQGGIVGHAVVELGDDASAEAHADRLLVGSIHPGIEVWDRARMLCCKMKNESGDV